MSHEYLELDSADNGCLLPEHEHVLEGPKRSRPKYIVYMYSVLLAFVVLIVLIGSLLYKTNNQSNLHLLPDSSPPEVYLPPDNSSFTLHLMIMGRNEQECSMFKERNNIKSHPWISTQDIICRVESGIINDVYTYNCSVTHDNLQVKTQKAWNSINVKADFYFKVDNDILLDIPTLKSLFNSYRFCGKKIVMGHVWMPEPNPRDFFVSGGFYGTNEPFKYELDNLNDELLFSREIPNNYHIVDLQGLYCGTGYKQKDDGHCVFLVRHHECLRDIWTGCHRSLNPFTCNTTLPISQLK